MTHRRAFFMIVTCDWRLVPTLLLGGYPDYFLNVYLSPKPSAKLVGLSV